MGKATISSGLARWRTPQILFLVVTGAILLACIGCCALLLFANNSQPNEAVIPLGMALVCFGSFAFPLLALIYLLFFTPESIRPEQVIDRWSNLIDGGHGQRTRIIASLYRGLAELDPPQTMTNERSLASGRWFGGGGRRPFVVISQTGNFRLQPYRIYVSIRDYGNALQTSWYLVAKPTVWQAMLQRFGLLNLDFFEEEDLRAYVTAVHHCFIASVIELMTMLSQDTSNLNRTSKGFLGVS